MNYKIIIFGTPYCVPCEQLKQELDRQNIKYEYIDIGKYPEYCKKYMITTVPTSIIFNDKNQIVDVFIGNGRKVIEKIKQKIENVKNE